MLLRSPSTLKTMRLCCSNLGASFSTGSPKLYRSPVKLDFYYDTISPVCILKFNPMLLFKKLSIHFITVFMGGFWTIASLQKFLESWHHLQTGLYCWSCQSNCVLTHTYFYLTSPTYPIRQQTTSFLRVCLHPSVPIKSDTFIMIFNALEKPTKFLLESRRVLCSWWECKDRLSSNDLSQLSSKNIQSVWKS